MANVIINGGQVSTNIRNVVLTITSPLKQYVYVSEIAAPTTVDIGSNWINTEGVDPFTLNFVVSPIVTSDRTRTVYVQFANDIVGTGYLSTNAVFDSIELYDDIRLPVIDFPIDGTEVTNRNIIVQGTAEAGATVTIKVEALN